MNTSTMSARQKYLWLQIALHVWCFSYQRRILPWNALTRAEVHLCVLIILDRMIVPRGRFFRSDLRFVSLNVLRRFQSFNLSEIVASTPDAYPACYSFENPMIVIRGRFFRFSLKCFIFCFQSNGPLEFNQQCLEFLLFHYREALLTWYLLSLQIFVRWWLSGWMNC